MTGNGSVPKLRADTEFVLKQSDETGGPGGGGKPKAPGKKARQPGWADGLRKLYDSVVDEPLPDSFEELLKKLDQAGHD